MCICLIFKKSEKNVEARRLGSKFGGELGNCAIYPISPVYTTQTTTNQEQTSKTQ